MKRNRRVLGLSDLPFRSILDERPKSGTLILMAWDINGYSGFESTWWDTDDERCKHCVMWIPLPTNQLYNRGCAIKASKSRLVPTILKWSKHFATYINGKYISEDKLRKVAESL